MLTIRIFKKHCKVLTIFSAVGAALIASGCSSTAPSIAPTAETSTAQGRGSASTYENKIVRRPGNSSEDGKIYFVEGGKKHWVVNGSWFAGHGFKFPDDVREIPSSELDAIPFGDPIK